MIILSSNRHQGSFNNHHISTFSHSLIHIFYSREICNLFLLTPEITFCFVLGVYQEKNCLISIFMNKKRHLCELQLVSSYYPAIIINNTEDRL